MVLVSEVVVGGSVVVGVVVVVATVVEDSAKEKVHRLAFSSKKNLKSALFHNYV